MMPNSTTNEQLVPMALAGDQDAYTQLYARLTPIVKRLGIRLFGQSVDADEFQCDALSKILMNIAKFNNGSQLTTWATRVAMNVGYEKMRRRKVHSCVVSLDDLSSNEDVDSTIGSTLADARDDYARSDAATDLQKILPALRPKHRAMLMDKYINGLTNVELAEETGTPRQTYGSRTYQALRRAREVLSRIEDGRTCTR